MVWVGENGMSFVWECVGGCIGAYPTSPSSPPALRSGAGSTMASTITTRRGPVLLCLCQRGWSSTPEVCQDWQQLLPLLCHSDGCKSSLQLFAYSEAPNCSLPGALELQSSWKCP